jgi:hypothetical protein
MSCGCSPSNINIRILPFSNIPRVSIKISPYTALPSCNIWTRGCNWVRWDHAQLLSLLHFSSLSSSHPKVLPPLQPTFTRRRTGTAWDLCSHKYISVCLLNVVSHSTSPTFSSLSLSLLRLQRVKQPSLNFMILKQMYFWLRVKRLLAWNMLRHIIWLPGLRTVHCVETFIKQCHTTYGCTTVSVLQEGCRRP